MQNKELVTSIIKRELAEHNVDLSNEEILKVLEKPPNQMMGDLAFPCFLVSAHLRKAPNQIAEQLSMSIESDYITKVNAVGPYLNFFLNRKKLGKEVVEFILDKDQDYGNTRVGKGENITIDFSSPNIAKPFSMGHLRSTVIGNAISNLADKLGYNVVKINHLGDWGTQFGKLIAAYRLWGDEETIKNNPIKELLKLYVRFHEEAENNPELEEDGRVWFKKLENGNEEALALWEWFRKDSLAEFDKIYRILDIEFDSYNGEAFYNDKMDNVVREIEEKGLLTKSDGAMVVSLDEYDIPPCLIKKSDGATLYATRDITAAIYRKNTYDFVQSLYVVGEEQSLHFKQIKHVLSKMGYKWAENMEHISFGMMLKNGKKMSTRKGKIVLLEDVLDEAVSLAKKNIEKKNPGLENKNDVAKIVGIGAVIFHDLKNFRRNDVEFSLESMLTFEGETGPYLQYTHARACSILEKAASLTVPDALTYEVFEDEKAWAIISLLGRFEEVLHRAMNKYDPSLIAKYILDLAQAFNRYYASNKILESNEQMKAKLKLVESTSIVIKEGLRILGIKAPRKM